MRGKIIWTIIIVGVAALLSLSFWPTDTGSLKAL